MMPPGHNTQLDALHDTRGRSSASQSVWTAANLSECIAMAVTVVVTPPVSYTANTCRCRRFAAADASPSSEDSDAVSYRSRFSRFRCSCRLCASAGVRRVTPLQLMLVCSCPQ